MSKFIITQLVRENRGRIECGKHPNGTPKYAQHSPYYAGLVLHNKINYARWFLDGFNSKYFLEQFLGYNNLPNGHPMRMLTFDMLLQTDEFRKIRDYITTVEVKDYVNYIKKNGIIFKRRNIELMQTIANESSIQAA